MLKLLSQLESPQELRKRFCDHPESFYDADYLVLEEELLGDDERMFLESLDQYFHEVLEDGRKGKQILILHLKGDYYYHRGRFTDAISSYEQATQMAREANDVLAEATINTALIGTCLSRQKWTRVDELFQRNDRIYEELDLVNEKINNLLLSSLFHQFSGCLEESAKLIKSTFHLNEMVANTPVRIDYLQNRVLIILARANLEKKLGHYLKALEYCEQAEPLLKEFIFHNKDSEELAWYQSIIFLLRTECYLDVGYSENANKILHKLEDLCGKFPGVIPPLKVGMLRAEYEFQFNNFPMSVEEWLTQLKDLFTAGETEFCLEQFLRVLRQFHKNYPISHYEGLLNYYESLLRLCERKLPLKVRKEFQTYYRFNPHHRIKISPHHMMLKFIEISRELMGEYHVPTLAKKVLAMMIDFTQMQRGFIALGAEIPEIEAVHQLRVKALKTRDDEENLCLKLAQFVGKRAKSLNLNDVSAVNLNDEVLSEEFKSDKWGEFKAKSVIVVPFMLEQRVLGMAYLDSRARRPAHNEDEMSFVENFAQNVAIALNNAKHFTQKDEALIKAQRLLDEQRAQMVHQFALSNFIGVSEKTREVLQLVNKVADSNATVLITGESGVGKELVAKSIHYNSLRKNKSFVGINCGAIPEQLLESELFGHEKGSFTDAIDSKIGLFEQANDGTIFLDEIGEMPLGMQVKLLRVLQEGEVSPIGAREPRSINVRVICATNRNLESLARQGLFRQDLYYRINVIALRVPPLRERKADVPLLIRHTLRLYADENHVAAKSISADALNYLMNYRWPGNVRELVNVVYNLSIFVETPRIELKDIKSRPELFHYEKPGSAAKTAPEDPLVKLSKRVEAGDISLADAKVEFEKIQIVRALRMCDGKITTASDFLHMPRPQVSRLMKKYRLRWEEKPEPENIPSKLHQ